MVPNVVSLVGSLHRQRVFERDEAIVDATREKLNTCNTLIAFESLRQSFYTPEHHPFINNEIKTYISHCMPMHYFISVSKRYIGIVEVQLFKLNSNSRGTLFQSAT